MVGGVDTHKDVHVVAVVDEVGRVIDTAAFATSAIGCRELIAWMGSLGHEAKVGVERVGAYGAEAIDVNLVSHMLERAREDVADGTPAPTPVVIEGRFARDPAEFSSVKEVGR